MNNVNFGVGLIIGMTIGTMLTHGLEFLNRLIQRNSRLCDRCGAELRHDK